MRADNVVGRNRLASLYLSHSHEALQLAHLLSDTENAPARSERAFLKSLAYFRDLRNPLTFEASLRRAVIKECRPSLGARLRRRPTPGIGGAPDSLWVSFKRQPHRRKAALALRYFEHLSDDQVADVLGCSTGTARALVNRALSELQSASERSSTSPQVAGELARLFNARVDNVPLPLEPDPKLLRRASTARRTVALSVILLLVAVAIGTVIVVRSATEGNEDGSSSLEVRSFVDEGLEPNTTVEELADELAIATGVAGGNRWHLTIQPGITDQICLTLVAGDALDSTRCDLPESALVRVYVESAGPLESTFIFGRAATDVATVELELGQQESIPLSLIRAPKILSNRPPNRFFMAVVPEYLVPLSDQELSDQEGSGVRSVIRSALQARGTDGAPLQRVPIYLGRN